MEYQPGQYVNAATGWSRECWLSKSVVFSTKFDSSLVSCRRPWLILRLIYQCIEPDNFELYRQREIRKVLVIFPSHALRHLFCLFCPLDPFPTADQPVLLDLTHFASSSPSFMNPFVHNAFSSITASLFDDEETSNVVFIVSEPPPGTRPSECYSKAAKNTAGLSRNRSGTSLEDSVRGGGPGGGTGGGRTSRGPELEERGKNVYAHTKLYGSRRVEVYKRDH